MKCATCGREGELMAKGAALVCAHCGTSVDRHRPGAGPEPAFDELSAGEREEQARLAKIHERAVAERAMKEAKAKLQQDPAKTSCLPCWAVLAGLVLLGAAGIVLFMFGGRSTNGAGVATEGKNLLWYAEHGDVGAQLGIGLVYHYGLANLPTVPGQAGKWYPRAAEAGDINAQYHLGLWYQSAAPSPSPQEALQWLTLAAERGHARAQTLVADAYRFGHHRERDLPRAADWYAKAAEQGDLDALCSLAGLNGGAEGYPQDQIAASMYDALAMGLGRECLRATGAADAPDWAKAAGVRRAKERLAQGFGKAAAR